MQSIPASIPAVIQADAQAPDAEDGQLLLLGVS